MARTLPDKIGGRMSSEQSMHLGKVPISFITKSMTMKGVLARIETISRYIRHKAKKKMGWLKS
jgi:hypothetical protein